MRYHPLRAQAPNNPVFVKEPSCEATSRTALPRPPSTRAGRSCRVCWPGARQQGACREARLPWLPRRRSQTGRPGLSGRGRKYAGEANAAAALAQSIRSGGSGKWGEIPMPPQNQVTEADAKKLARWILDGAK